MVAVAPDPTEPKPCSRLLICLQISQPTIAGKVTAGKAALKEWLPKYNGKIGFLVCDMTKAAHCVAFQVDRSRSD
jgi:hypothetical protein